MKSITIPSSSAEALRDPAAFLRALRKGMPDFGPEAVAALAAELAEEELEDEMVSYRKNVTGIYNTIFISPKGKTQRAARLKVAIDPPDAISPHGKTASIAVHDGAVKAGEPVPGALLDQVQQFIELNRDVLLDFWEYRIDTDELRQRLKAI